ncbi:hypothetical protein BGW39_007193 [Mortierella sp. 14UC]|nr:hypothetical protein BGW39_007193 [Mortierella sp. 14UC]
MAVRSNNGVLDYYGYNVDYTTYNLKSDWWATMWRPCESTENSTQIFKSQQVALVNPKADIVYIPYAYDKGNQMLVLESNNAKCSGVTMPVVAATAYYAWSEAKDTLYMLGDTAPATGPTMWEFQPITKNWTKLTMHGDGPAILSDSCMISAFGGQKLLLFGGANSANATTGDIFIFDTATYTWTKMVTSESPRGGMACASAADYMVVWGGYNDRTKLLPLGEFLFYNIKTDKWKSWIQQTTAERETRLASISRQVGFNTVFQAGS